jgi:hypothetical protein
VRLVIVMFVKAEKGRPPNPTSAALWCFVGVARGAEHIIDQATAVFKKTWPDLRKLDPAHVVSGAGRA